MARRIPRVVIGEPAKIELEFRDRLRAASLARIEEEDWSTEEVAKLLGLLPSGVENLLRRTDWTLERAVRVAACLGVVFQLHVEEDS